MKKKKTSPTVLFMGLLPRSSSPLGLLCDNRAIPCISLAFAGWRHSLVSRLLGRRLAPGVPGEHDFSPLLWPLRFLWWLGSCRAWLCPAFGYHIFFSVEFSTQPETVQTRRQHGHTLRVLGAKNHSEVLYVAKITFKTQ